MRGVISSPQRSQNTDEGVAVVGVAVDPHHVGLGVDAVHGVGDVVDVLEEPRDLVDAVDEHEAAHLGELRADGVHEVQREPGEGRHRPRDVGDDDDLGLGRPRVAELGVDRHAPGRQRVPHGGAEVEWAPCGRGGACGPGAPPACG